VDVRKHPVDRDHGIIESHATPQCFVAGARQIHLVTAGRELFHELTSGFRVVLDDENMAAIPRHGSLSADRRKPIQNASSAIITMMWCGAFSNTRSLRRR